MKILIVEDCAQTRRAWARPLRSHGHDVTLAQNLAEAHAALVLRAPDLVLLDLELPDGWGTNLFESINTMSPRPIVALTSAHISADVVAESLRTCAAMIPKPISGKTLLACVDGIMGTQAPDAWLSTDRGTGRAMYGLSRQELEVMRAAAQGLSIKETAMRLRCTSSTVSGYRHRAITKIGGRTLSQALLRLASDTNERPVQESSNGS